MTYVFQNHWEIFFSPVGPTLSIECSVFEMGEKNPSAFIVGKGEREGPVFALSCVRFYRFWCLHQAERQDISSLSNTKSRHVSALTVCSL